MSFTNRENNAELLESKPPRGLNGARLEIPKGAVTASQGHQMETIIVVLEGEWRFSLAGRTTTLRKDEILRIPAHERYSSEALADTIALKIATAPNHARQQPTLPHDDPDQYLWGV